MDGPWPPIKLDPCIGATCNAGPAVIHDCIACTVFDPGGVVVHPGDVKVVGNVPGLGPSVLSEAGGYLPLAPGALSPEVVSLLGSNAVQVAAVEPVRSVGQGARVPQSLFVSSDGVRLLGAITVLGDSVLTTDVARRMLLERGGRTLDASGEATAAWTPETVPDAVEVAEGEPVPPPGAAGTPVYSAYLGELLLVRSGGAGAGAGEVWRRDVRSTAGWQRVVLGATALGTVKAATYTYGDGAMWVLDEVRGALGLRFARLVRVGLDGSGAKVMASWPKLGVYDTHWLLVDRDGGLVLVASSTKTLSHAVAKLSTSGGGLHVAALRFAQGGLAVPPMIDRNGYRFFVKRHKKDHLVDTVRLDALAPSSLPLGHVGGCFLPPCAASPFFFLSSSVSPHSRAAAGRTVRRGKRLLAGMPGALARPARPDRGGYREREGQGLEVAPRWDRRLRTGGIAGTCLRRIATCICRTTSRPFRR